jgi:hypothetical protein
LQKRTFDGITAPQFGQVRIFCDAPQTGQESGCASGRRLRHVTHALL